MASINMPQKTESALPGILGIINTVSSLKKNSTENDLNNQKIEAQTLSNKQAQVQQQNSEDVLKQKQTPGSPLGESIKKGLAARLSMGLEMSGSKDPNAQSYVLNTIKGMQDPNVTAFQAEQNVENTGLLKSFDEFGKAKIQGINATNAATIKAGPQWSRLEETKNENSIHAGKEWETDPIIKLAKGNLNSLTKSQSILSNPNKPVTSKDLNLAYNDYINSVAAGGSATEGKISRELPETWATEFNTLKAKAGQFDDLRNSPTGKQLIDQLSQNISTVRHDMTSAIEDQAGNIYSNFANSTNQKVKDTAKQKLKAYAPNKYSQMFGGPAPQQSYTSNGGQETAKQPPGGHMSVQQGGHTFNWNPQTGNYE